MTLRIGVVGGSGRLGRLIVQQVLATPGLTLASVIGSRAVGADAGEIAGVGPCGVLVQPLSAKALRVLDVVIDASVPEVLRSALPLLEAAALVSGTTGLSDADIEAIEERSQIAPVLSTANFSTGVTLLAWLVAEAARALPDFDVEIVETHHRAKVDSPSGTALLLGWAAADARGWTLEDVGRNGRGGRVGERPPAEIGFHAVRGGDIVGDHQVRLLGTGESVTLEHRATSRVTFALGAVRAARWIAGRPPGRYTMRDVLGLDRGDG